MDLFPAFSALVARVTLFHLAIVAAAIVGVVLLRRSGILFSSLEIENRQLRRGLQGYAHMEQTHRELSQEASERNRVHAELPLLIARLGEERSVEGIEREVVRFAARALGASEVSLFLAEGGALILRETTGSHPAGTRVRMGHGPIGAVAEFRRTLAIEDFRGLDAGTRDRLLRGARLLDTVVASPLLAHGAILGVLNVGGSITSPPSIRKEILAVIAQLGATALENQINFDRLEREATTDGLTGISNVRNFRAKCREEMSRAARFGRPLSVFLFDVDHFKNYNDRNGHPAGDECLRLTAGILRSNTRATDLPARYGGEEFIVLLPETGPEGATAFAEKIRAAIEATEFPHGDGQPLGRLTVSGGVASFPHHGHEVDTLVAAADAALYASKSSGRNRVLLADILEPPDQRVQGA